MKKIHFFKAKSRIGLKNKPIHQTELNFGVEEGPEAVLSPDFLKNFPGSKLEEFEFPKPEDIPEAEFNKVLADSIEEFKICLLRMGVSPLKRRDPFLTQIVIGGDHSVVLPSILADLARGINPKNLGILHIDSHGDINLSQDSPTDNFHGMYLRPLFDSFDIPEIEAIVSKKIPTENLMIIGNLDLDPGEERFLTEHQVQRGLTSKEVRPLLSWVNQFEHLHVSFDIDSMDQTIAPATGIPAKKGLLWKDLGPILEIIKFYPSFSFDLCEVNPKKNGAKKTIKLAQRILRLILK